MLRTFIKQLMEFQNGQNIGIVAKFCCKLFEIYEFLPAKSFISKNVTLFTEDFNV